ncbi:hypothetical protein CACET_c10870 [Clostridium aceticum]|uniref:Uncharacterized protein n=1 Tax=Clostridium aceticum TaxID=84022 RepID=A0A0D8I581_9CLOT|nr:hypothetical protein [Clostridium aceticum]AKL94570.1 hypothetical protein CACET_c10870 [Clostridium aceticum]KJF25435.1 hypothetical protein TZ02_18680 [Clostridium aceticum]
MDRTKELLVRLEYWRNFPGYQLERHIDILFSFHLRDIIKHKYGIDSSDYVIPEFPINQNLTTKKRKGEYSDNIDFVVSSKDLKTVFFVELKTDMKSIRQDQNDLMKICDGMPFADVLKGLVDIAKVTKEYSKYATLIYYLNYIGYIEAPKKLWTLNYGSTPYGYKRAISEIIVNEEIDAKVKSVFIQPQKTQDKDNIIDFSSISTLIKPKDPLFADLLSKCVNSPGFVEFTEGI